MFKIVFTSPTIVVENHPIDGTYPTVLIAEAGYQLMWMIMDEGDSINPDSPRMVYAEGDEAAVYMVASDPRFPVVRDPEEIIN